MARRRLLPPGEKKLLLFRQKATKSQHIAQRLVRGITSGGPVSPVASQDAP
jgi:hypothetical protein